MSDELAVALGIDLEDPAQLRAIHLVEQDANLMRELLDVRLQRGLSIESVAERMGVDVEQVRSLERYDTDPRLSQLRRYAHAIGAFVSHEVQADPRSA